MGKYGIYWVVDIVLKNKLKNLRKDIKDWWNIISSEIHKKKKEIQDFLCDWDSKAEAGLLSPMII